MDRIFSEDAMRQMNWVKAAFVGVPLALLLLVQGVYALQTEQGTEVPLIFDEGIAGKIEITVYYGRWSLNLFKGLFEDDLIDEISDEIQQEIISQVRGIRSDTDLIPTNFDQTFTFDSGGPNYGLELRFYPQGREGAFSLGFSLDKTKIRLTIQGDVRQNFNDGSYAEVKDALGEITLNPLFTTLNFRWDFKPDWMVTPYFVFGVGMASLSGEVSYDYIGSYKWHIFEQEVGESETKTIKEAEEDSDINLPNILPLLQINLGIRAEVIPHLHLRVEAGIWDGFALRAGVGYRF
jgi:hypothetical protein